MKAENAGSMYGKPGGGKHVASKNETGGKDQNVLKCNAETSEYAKVFIIDPHEC